MKKFTFITCMSVLFFLSILALDTEAFASLYHNNISANTKSGEMDKEPGGRKIIELYESQSTVPIEQGDSSGSYFVKAEDGYVYAWGNNKNGQLGIGDEKEIANMPELVKIDYDNFNVKNIYAFEKSVYYDFGDNLIYGSGASWYGGFGLGETEIIGKSHYLPTKLEIKPNDILNNPEDIDHIYYGSEDVYVIKKNGDMYGVGFCASGQLGKDGCSSAKGIFISEYVKIPDIFKGVIPMAIELNNTFGLKDNCLVGWGYGSFGGLANGTIGVETKGDIEKTSAFAVPQYLKKSNNTNLCDVKTLSTSAWGQSGNKSIGQVTGLVIDNENDVWTWGSNEYGQAGLGHANVVPYLTQIPNLKARDVVASVRFSIILPEDGVQLDGVDVSGKMIGSGLNLGYVIDETSTEDEKIMNYKILKTGEQYSTSGYMENVQKVMANTGSLSVLTKDFQIFTRGLNSLGQQGTAGGTDDVNKEFKKVIIPIKPIITDATRLDTDNKVIADDPSTTKDESKYTSTVDENGKIRNLDKYNSSVNISVKREGMLSDDGINETAIDYGDMKYEYCELEYNEKKEPVCKTDEKGKEIWVSSADNLISKRTAYPEVDDVELVDVNHTPDDPSDDVMKVKEHNITVDLNSKGSPQKAFRKYRFYYDEVRERYDTETSEFDPYSYFIVDLDRGDPEVHYLNLKENTNQEIVDADGTYDKLLAQQILRDEQYFGHGIRIYLPKGAKAYVVIEKTKNGKKQDETIPGFGDPIIPVLVEGQAPMVGVNYNDFFPQTVGNGYYRIYYVNEYGNSTELHFRISHDRDRPLVLPNDNDSGGGDWQETIFDADGNEIGKKQHYGGIYIVDMDMSDPAKWDTNTNSPVRNYTDAAGDEIYAIEGTAGTYTSDALPDRPKTIENNEVIQHAWINHSLWLTVTGQDVIKTTSTLDSLRLYKLDEQGNRIQPADSVVNFDEGNVTQIKNNYAIPVKENGNYELVLQDFAGNENVSQGNEARGVFFTVNFIDTKPPVIQEPVLVRNPKTNQLNITLEAKDEVSGVVKDDAINHVYGMYYQFVKDGDEPDDTKWLSYTQDEKEDAHILHVPSPNFIGKLYVKAYDNAGNIAGAYDASNEYANMIAFDIADDSDAPIITYNGGNPTNWQNTDAIVSFTASDNMALEKVELVTLPDMVKVDSFEPNYQNKTYSECKRENHNCVLNDTEVSFEFTITTNGKYQVIAYDMAGNQTIAIIDNTKTDPVDKMLDVTKIDKDDPLLSEIARTKKGELKITASDVLSGIKTSGTPANLVYDGIEYLILSETDRLSMSETDIQNSPNWKKYDPAKLVDINQFKCYVYVRISDKAGNQVTDFKVFEPMDVEPPLYVTSQEAAVTKWRRGDPNGAVKISVNYTDNEGLAEIEVRCKQTSSSGQLTDHIGNPITEDGKTFTNTKDDWFHFYVNENGTYEVRAKDINGNQSDWQEIEVDLIDNIAPTMILEVNQGKFKITSVTDGQSGIAQVKDKNNQTVDDIMYQFVQVGDSLEESNYQCIKVKEEINIPTGFTGTLYVRTRDNAPIQFQPNSKGNEKLITKSFEKAEASDKEPPVLISYSGNPVAWQNTDAKLTLHITDNESGIKRVSVKDQLSGVIIFNKTDFSEKQLSATILDVTIKTNGTYIVEMEDAQGNVSDNALEDNLITVTKIDKHKPVIEHISWVNGGSILFPSGDLIADVSDYDEPKEDNSTIVLYKYAFVKKGEATPDVSTWATVTKDEMDQLLKTNRNFVGKLVLRAIDGAGNESETLTATVGEDTTKDSRPVIELVVGDREPWLKAGQEMEITVRAKESTHGITHVEVMDHASGLSTTYAPYDNDEPDYEWHTYRFKVTENGMYTIKATNAQEDSATLPIYISHFDTTAPTISSIEWIKGNPQATIHASDPLPGSGLNLLYYQLVNQGETLDDAEWLMLSDTNKITMTSGFNGSIYAKACDKVGNCSDISIQSLYSDPQEGETDRPVVELLHVKDDVDSEEGEAQIRVSDRTSGVKYYVVTGPGVIGSAYVMVEEAEKLSSEHLIRFNQNGVYTVVAYDYEGNISDPVSFSVEHLKDGKDSYVQLCKTSEKLLIDVDSDGNGIPDLNLDPFHSGVPTINIDLDCDGIPDVNIDTTGDGKPDLNIDHNDGIPYKNLITLTTWAPNKDFTLTDGFHFETMTGLQPNEQHGGGMDDDETPNSGGSVQGSYYNGNRFIAPMLGSMANHPWWWILLLLLSIITMRWGYKRASIYIDEKKMEKYLKDHPDDAFYF